MSNNNKMNSTTSRSVKINFQGASRDVGIPAQATLAGLQAAIASTFKIDLPARSGSDEAAKDSDLHFTYKDPDGDNIVFDKDSELVLALRLCPTSLEIAATGKEPVEPPPATKEYHEYKLFKVAARNLREYNGVPSMTPLKLTKTLTFLKLNPRRLVNQGLAAEALLADVMKGRRKGAAQPLGDDDNNDDLVESVAAGMEAMNVEEDDKKEWNDGFIPVEATPTAGDSASEAASNASGSSGKVAANTASPNADDGSPTNSEDGDDAVEEEDADADAAGACKGPVHKAFIAGGIKLLPREVWPLLVALGVEPRRLVKLGLVDAGLLRKMACSHKMAHKKKQRIGRGGVGPAFDGSWAPPCGPHAPVGPGAGSGVCPRGRMARKFGSVKHHRGPVMMRSHPHPHPFARPPPPQPPAHMPEDGMFFAPADGFGFGGGRRTGPPAHYPPHPYAFPHGFGAGEGGPGFYHGPPRHPRGSEDEEEGAGFHHGPPHHPRPHHPNHGGPEDEEGAYGFHHGPRHHRRMMKMQHRLGRQPLHQPGNYYYWG